MLGPLRIPVPLWCGPRVSAREDALGEARRRVDARIALPIVGALLTYDGTIDIVDTAEASS